MFNEQYYKLSNRLILFQANTEYTIMNPNLRVVNLNSLT